MKIKTLKQLLLYNYRYLFAYGVIIVFAIYFLTWQLGSIGPGLSDPELASAAQHVSFKSIVDLPLYPLHSILQWLSMTFLDVGIISIRLPSIIMTAATAFFLYHLLKRWFGKSTALLSIAIFLSADWVLFFGRLGVGSIEFTFWLSLAFLTFIKLLEHKSRWLIVFAGTLCGLAFTPFGPYVIAALVGCILGFSTFRKRILETPVLVKILTGIVLAIGVLSVLFISIHNFIFLKSLLGLVELPSISNYFVNLFANTSGIVLVLPSYNPLISAHGIFFIRFFELIFILFGIAMLWRTRVNRLNLIILTITVVLVVISGLNDGPRGGSLILAPAIIYMTAGIRHLIHRWQRTFPKNPYARMASLIPMGILFACVIALHYQSYFVLWPKQSATHAVFSPDFKLAKDELKKTGFDKCVVAGAKDTLTTVLKKTKVACDLSFTAEARSIAPGTKVLAAPGTLTLPPDAKISSTPLVNETKEASLRWHVVTVSD
jgi:hypothetical protein